jgi:aspartate carbamoyltransferase catalytic subunit
METHRKNFTIIQTQLSTAGVARMMTPLNNPLIIFDQVTNGVAVRMARLYPVAGGGRNDID